MKMFTFSFLFLFFASMSCSSSGIEVSSSPTPTNTEAPPVENPEEETPPTLPDPGSPPEEPIFNVIIVTHLANRLVEVQNDDGSYGWRRAETEPLDTTQQGFQNVTGATLLGMFDMMTKIEAKTEWKNTIEQTLQYLSRKLSEHDPDVEGKRISCTNWIFMVSALNLFSSDDLTRLGINNLQSRLIAEFDRLLEAREDPSLPNRAEGYLSWIAQRRNTIPGIIPWDFTSCAEAMEKMSTLSSLFVQDAIDGRHALISYLQGTFLPNYDVDPTMLYGNISLALPLAFLASFDETPLSLRNDLAKRLTTLLQPNGNISNQGNETNPQSTAYGLLALKRIDHPSLALVQDFLEHQINTEGILYVQDTSTSPPINDEYFLIEGEVLRALLF